MPEIVTRRGSFVITVARNGKKVTSETLTDPMRAVTRFMELVHSQTVPGEYVVNTSIRLSVGETVTNADL